MKIKRIYSYVDVKTNKFIEKESKKRGVSKASYIYGVLLKEIGRGKKTTTKK